MDSTTIANPSAGVIVGSDDEFDVRIHTQKQSFLYLCEILCTRRNETERKKKKPSVEFRYKLCFRPSPELSQLPLSTPIDVEIKCQSR